MKRLKVNNAGKLALVLSAAVLMGRMETLAEAQDKKEARRDSARTALQNLNSSAKKQRRAEYERNLKKERVLNDSLNRVAKEEMRARVQKQHDAMNNPYQAAADTAGE